MWPYARKIYYGIFVKEQVEALNAYFPEIENKTWFLRGYLGKVLYLTSIVSLNIHLFFHRYDVIHIHSALSGIFLLFGPKRSNVIITLHGTEVLDDRQYRISKHVIRKVNTLVCVSREIEDKVLLEYPDARTCVIPCAVRESFFNDNRIKSGEHVTIAFASASWREVKNYPLFMEVIDLLRSMYPQREIRTAEFDNQTREEIRETLNTIDLLLVTSFHEGSPQIVKEALCCNVPVVSANVGSVKQMLDGLLNCAVVDGYNAADYAAAVADILFRDGVSFPVRSDGRKRIHDLQYDEKTITAKIMKLYRDAILPN
jgi:glycosyltransferase involved in cell wall biosynthesis